MDPFLNVALLLTFVDQAICVDIMETKDWKKIYFLLPHFFLSSNSLSFLLFTHQRFFLLSLKSLRPPNPRKKKIKRKRRKNLHQKYAYKSSSVLIYSIPFLITLYVTLNNSNLQLMPMAQIFFNKAPYKMFTLSLFK